MRQRLETPDEIRQQIWKELGRASQDRHHAWRTPVLATASQDGEVHARTVVLRSADAARGTFTVFTDRRSGKVSDIAHQPHAQFLFWSSRLHWQLRVRVHVSVRTHGPDVEALWQRVSLSASAADYMAPVAPGTPQAGPDSPLAEHGRDPHFAVLTAQVIEMDWLELDRAGHRRARLRPDEWAWLTP